MAGRIQTAPYRVARSAQRAGVAGALIALLIIVVACGSSTATPTGGTASAGASAAQTAAGSNGAVSVPSVAADDRFAATFAALGAGYTFDSTITVGGKVATHANGRWVGGSSEFVIESGGISITYRSIPPVAWVLKTGADWVVVDGAIPGGDPLDALAKPLAVAVTADGADGVTLVGRYTPADLGLTTTGTVPVTLLLAPDGSVIATYSADATGGAATSVVVLRPAISPEPVVAPVPAASPS